MSCPICEEGPFFHTGAFWRCGACGYMITGQALRRAEERTKSRASREPKRTGTDD